jgi:hypothetical protein
MERGADASWREQLLEINHEIRQIEAEREYAGKRRLRARRLIWAGPVLILIGYLAIAETDLSHTMATPFLIIGGAVTYGAMLKAAPGGHHESGSDQIYFGNRRSELELELELAKLRDQKKDILANFPVDIAARRAEYKEDVYSEIDQLRIESNSYRLRQYSSNDSDYCIVRNHGSGRHCSL